MNRRWDHQDRKHWEIQLGRVSISRWCKGAPCSHHNWPAGQSHPITLVIARKR